MLPVPAIDVHAHFLPPVYREALAGAGFTLLDGGMPIPAWSEEAAIGLMDGIGIETAMLSVSSPFATTIDRRGAPALCRAINDFAADLRQRNARFGAYAMLPVPMIAESLGELDRALDTLGLDGVALPTNALGAYLGSANLAPLLDALDERGATVFVHPTSPCCFEQFGLAFPAPMIEFPFDTTRAIASLLYGGNLARRRRIRFVFAHGGGTLPFLMPRIARIGSTQLVGAGAIAEAEAAGLVRSWHYDLALAGSPDQVAALKSIVPVSQIVYGTDYPFAQPPHIVAAASRFAELPFDENERMAVCRGNALNLFASSERFACCG